MAPVALLAEPPIVDIILLMARETTVGNLHIFAHGVTMARLTFQPFMGAFELIARLRIVIEFPQIPSIRIVAPRAIGSQRALMKIIRFVTRDTGRFSVLVRRRQMTFPARSDGMHADKRKIRQVVVKFDLLPPSALVVTRITFVPLLSAVHIICPVTAVT